MRASRAPLVGITLGAFPHPFTTKQRVSNPSAPQQFPGVLQKILNPGRWRTHECLWLFPVPEQVGMSDAGHLKQHKCDSSASIYRRRGREWGGHRSMDTLHVGPGRNYEASCLCSPELHLPSRAPWLRHQPGSTCSSVSSPKLQLSSVSANEAPPGLIWRQLDAFAVRHQTHKAPEVFQRQLESTDPMAKGPKSSPDLSSLG